MNWKTRAFLEGFLDGLCLWCTWPTWTTSTPKRKTKPEADKRTREPMPSYMREYDALKYDAATAFQRDMDALQADFERVMKDCLPKRLK